MVDHHNILPSTPLTFPGILTLGVPIRLCHSTWTLIPSVCTLLALLNRMLGSPNCFSWSLTLPAGPEASRVVDTAPPPLTLVLLPLFQLKLQPMQSWGSHLPCVRLSLMHKEELLIFQSVPVLLVVTME